MTDPGQIAIRRVCVIGAGVMGAAIAAQVANAGVSVLLLDLDTRAADAVARMLDAEPAPFMTRDAARLVETGSSDDLSGVAACDWVIEVITERLDAKQALYRRIGAARRPGTPVSSNTSTIPLATLIDGMPDGFAQDFCVTHFFNPPRIMRLLEFVTGPTTDSAVATRVAGFCDTALGKTVVRCHDRPGFIANRIGTYWLQLGVNAALDLGVSVEEADAVVGRPMGIPKTGVFGLLDLIGLDLMPHIAETLTRSLPAGDAFHASVRRVPLIDAMIADGRTGRKGKGGFYRARGKEAIDLATGEYRPTRTVAAPDGRDLRALLTANAYAWRVLGPTLAYAAAVAPEVADDIEAVDAAMRLGYAWKRGPFELIDALGVGWFVERLEADGLAVSALLRTRSPFYRAGQALGFDGSYHDVERPEGVLVLADIRARTQPVLRNGPAALWDLGDGVACFELTSKMGALDREIMDLLELAIATVRERFRALVLYSDADHFSAGANLGHFLAAAKAGAWDEIEALIEAGQRAFTALKYAPFPVVAAPAGLALGGGCELVLHADAVVAHAELSIGLVECGVGLVPGWGGSGETLLRSGDAVAVFEQIRTSATSRSAAHARALHYLRDDDTIVMNRDRLLAAAKARAVAMVDGYRPPARPTLALPDAMPVEGLRGRAEPTSHDLTVAASLARVLSGDGDEDAMLARERAAFMALIRTEPTLARIAHVLDTGKTLRN